MRGGRQVAQWLVVQEYGGRQAPLWRPEFRGCAEFDDWQSRRIFRQGTM